MNSQNGPFLRLRFSIYRSRGSSYSWQAFQKNEAQLSPNYPQFEAERARYAWLRGAVWPPSGKDTVKPADSARRARQRCMARLFSASRPESGWRSRVHARRVSKPALLCDTWRHARFHFRAGMRATRNCRTARALGVCPRPEMSLSWRRSKGNR
jgi:hypothetical protein